MPAKAPENKPHPPQPRPRHDSASVNLYTGTGCAARHEAQHSPRLRLAPACCHARPRPGVAELEVVRRCSRVLQMNAQQDTTESGAAEAVRSAMWQLYVLELEHGCYYVGIAFDVNRRFIEHVTGFGGANFTKAHKPLRIVETFCCGTDDRDVAAKIENQKTLDYAVKHGGDRVKGGRYFIPSKLIRKVTRLRTELLSNANDNDRNA